MKVESIQLSMRHCFEWSHHEWIVHIGVVSIDGKAFSKKTILLELLTDLGCGEVRGGPLRQHVIVIRGRFGTQVNLALDLDVMVKVGHQHKRVS